MKLSLYFCLFRLYINQRIVELRYLRLITHRNLMGKP